MVVVFADPATAVMWALAVRRAGLALEWPPDLLEHELAEEVWADAFDAMTQCGEAAGPDGCAKAAVVRLHESHSSLSDRSVSDVRSACAASSAHAGAAGGGGGRCTPHTPAPTPRGHLGALRSLLSTGRPSRFGGGGGSSGGGGGGAAPSPPVSGRLTGSSLGDDEQRRTASLALAEGGGAGSDRSRSRSRGHRRGAPGPPGVGGGAASASATAWPAAAAAAARPTADALQLPDLASCFKSGSAPLPTLTVYPCPARPGGGGLAGLDRPIAPGESANTALASSHLHSESGGITLHHHRPSDVGSWMNGGGAMGRGSADGRRRRGGCVSDCGGGGGVLWGGMAATWGGTVRLLYRGLRLRWGVARGPLKGSLVAGDVSGQVVYGGKAHAAASKLAAKARAGQICATADVARAVPAALAAELVVLERF
ncbi:hypothetical protein GPECTOR_13g829 [Gonium pectorale]|uniref:Guanylate cyclase domain-containing protein n=1 Tax=Gonium pectorale TaxID=33097 RepID=A0A150GNG9_GONPE|nr:hypothetical protein GPECTOR_13g829 [Gonium pectorale]|eukprot:KXZ51341.1 hypothetical protein GPECTOR_13g829 [Gonium pectorale]